MYYVNSPLSVLGQQRLAVTHAPPHNNNIFFVENNVTKKHFDRYGTVKGGCSVYETPFVVVPPKAPLRLLCPASLKTPLPPLPPPMPDVLRTL